MAKTFKTATFSNGHTDVYKGARDVTAAWMVITPEGKIISGHSLDARRAQTTAAGSAGEACPHRELKMSGTRGRDTLTPHCAKWFHEIAVKAGFKDRAAYNADAAAKRAAWIAQCQIEVVGL